MHRISKRKKKMTETGYKSVIWAYFEIFEPNYSIILLKKLYCVRLYACLRTQYKLLINHRLQIQSKLFFLSPAVSYHLKKKGFFFGTLEFRLHSYLVLSKNITF